MCFIKINEIKNRLLPFIGGKRPSSSRHKPSPIRRSSIFRRREVILLLTASENEFVRGQSKMKKKLLDFLNPVSVISWNPFKRLMKKTGQIIYIYFN